MLVYSRKGCPAVADDKTGRAWAVLSPGANWSEVDYSELIATGQLLRGQSLDQAFPNLPPLPQIKSGQGGVILRNAFTS